MKYTYHWYCSSMSSFKIMSSNKMSISNSLNSFCSTPASHCCKSSEENMVNYALKSVRLVFIHAFFTFSFSKNWRETSNLLWRDSLTRIRHFWNGKRNIFSNDHMSDIFLFKFFFVRSVELHSKDSSIHTSRSISRSFSVLILWPIVAKCAFVFEMLASTGFSILPVV